MCIRKGIIVSKHRVEPALCRYRAPTQSIKQHQQLKRPYCLCQYLHQVIIKKAAPMWLDVRDEFRPRDSLECRTMEIAEGEKSEGQEG